MRVEIFPVDKREKQIVKEFGTIWNVNTKSGPHSMFCFNGELGINVTSLCGKHNRNVRFNENVKVINDD